MSAPASEGDLTGAGSGGMPLLRFGFFELDPKNRELRRKGALLDLSPQAFRLLTFLARRPGQLATREEIRKELWPDEEFADLDSRLNFEIKRIRERLGDDADNPRYVETVRKSGYKFIAPVKWIEAQTSASGAQAELGGILSARQSSTPHRPGLGTAGEQASTLAKATKSRTVVAAALLAAALITAAVVLWPRKGQDAPQASSGAGNPKNNEITPVIKSVTPILPNRTQTIVIKGRGFGIYTAFQNLDTPFLAIRDNSAHWAAGRIIPENPDDVTLSVTSWTDSEIIVTGFAGAYGQDTWELHPEDRIEVAVWNPQTGAGPASYSLLVSRASPVK